MKRYAAFLRGVMPTNCKMPVLKAAFEAEGFEEVKTLLGSGNVLFNAASTSVATLERKVEAALTKRLGRHFPTIVRSVDTLRDILESDPYQKFGLKPGSKRVVTFLRDQPTTKLDLPIELHGARILTVEGNEAFSVYVPGAKGPVFMTLIERTFGKDQTTRTWETVTKAAR